MQFKKPPIQSKNVCNVISDNQYQCDCHYPYHGKNCEKKITICDTQIGKICQNEASCIGRIDEKTEQEVFSCECKSGWKGPFCEATTILEFEKPENSKNNRFRRDLSFYWNNTEDSSLKIPDGGESILSFDVQSSGNEKNPVTIMIVQFKTENDVELENSTSETQPNLYKPTFCELHFTVAPNQTISQFLHCPNSQTLHFNNLNKKISNSTWLSVVSSTFDKTIITKILEKSSTLVSDNILLSIEYLTVHPKFIGKLRDVKLNQQNIKFTETSFKNLELGEISWRNGSVRYSTYVEIDDLENVAEMVCNAEPLNCENKGYCKPWAKYGDSNLKSFYGNPLEEDANFKLKKSDVENGALEASLEYKNNPEFKDDQDYEASFSEQNIFEARCRCPGIFTGPDCTEILTGAQFSSNNTDSINSYATFLVNAKSLTKFDVKMKLTMSDVTEQNGLLFFIGDDSIRENGLILLELRDSKLKMRIGNSTRLLGSAINSDGEAHYLHLKLEPNVMSVRVDSDIVLEERGPSAVPAISSTVKN